MFDQAGSAYTFDPNSGYFYEPISNFYYEPKSRLYYGTVEGIYYRYDPEVKDDSGFVKVQQQSQQENAVDTTATEFDKVDERGSKDRKKIMIGKIKLKTASKAPVSVDIPKVTDVTPASAKKKDKHDFDISKWTNRQEREYSANANAILDYGCLVSGISKEDSKTYATKSGAPVCLLCQRKFTTIEKLRAHQKLSILHKENLGRQSVLSKQGVLKYEDRAKHRRSMHNASEVSRLESHSSKVEEMALSQGPSLYEARTVHFTETVRPEDSVSTSNIGHQMLQKLGWKKGEVLGAKREKALPGTEEMTKKLKKDWEAIETLAFNNK